MVGTRWESSNRPLFIRTVWKDGHHHVVLQKDEEITAQTSRSGRRNLSSNRNRKTAPPSSEPSATFKVPSVKLLLASLRTMRDARPKRPRTEARDFIKSAITVDIIPSDSVRYSDLNKQVSFKNERKFPPKSHSMEMHHFQRGTDSLIATPPPFSYDNYCLDHFNNSLSERVMIWLDLAIQNRQIKNVDLKKRVVTAQACPIVQREKSVKIRDQERLKKKNEAVFETNEVAPGPLVTSRIECDRLDPIDKQLKVRTSTAKRQLHIFLPHLPKKCSDSGSFLSSKNSSLVVRSINSYKN